VCGPILWYFLPCIINHVNLTLICNILHNLFKHVCMAISNKNNNEYSICLRDKIILVECWIKSFFAFLFVCYQTLNFVLKKYLNIPHFFFYYYYWIHIIFVFFFNFIIILFALKLASDIFYSLYFKIMNILFLYLNELPCEI
jgi:hypothetical protein